MQALRVATIRWLDQVLPIALWVGGGALLVVLYLWEPAASGLFPPCPFHAITGLHCPGCGSLRGMHQLLHGELWAAFRLNPLMVIALPLLGYAVVSAHWRSLRPNWIDRETKKAAWPLAILVVVCAYWALRNLPFEPFSWLAPTRLS